MNRWDLDMKILRYEKRGKYDYHEPYHVMAFIESRDYCLFNAVASVHDTT